MGMKMGSSWAARNVSRILMTRLTASSSVCLGSRASSTRDWASWMASLSDMVVLCLARTLHPHVPAVAGPVGGALVPQPGGLQGAALPLAGVYVHEADAAALG